MFDEAQLLERFRLLSRDIQNGIQTIEAHFLPLKPQISSDVFGQVETSLNNVRDSWADFAGWVLISTLDNLESTRSNCAPAKLSIQGKINRAKKRRTNSLKNKSITFNLSEVENIVMDTFIPYFEQLLDIVVDNAIKYTIRNSEITISASRKFNPNFCVVRISSLGPHVEKEELLKLGQKGFRSKNARKLNVTGEGYGLYNAIRIANLLGGSINFDSHKNCTYISGIGHSVFNITIKIPDMSEQ